MKTFTFLIWVVTCIVVSSLLLSEIPDFSTFNGIFYLVLMMLLIAISIVGALMEYPKKINHYRFK
ncbi:MAG: hypothetical protein ACLGH8_09050 [Bacteroidia bacterium]